MLRQLRRAAVGADGDNPADGQLLEVFVTRRDDAAFGALVQQHGPMVLGVCRRGPRTGDLRGQGQHVDDQPEFREQREADKLPGCACHHPSLNPVNEVPHPSRWPPLKRAKEWRRKRVE